uniref:Uncharacterized protein n=1 Tax=Pithovirus LCPAC304 TaxID=2506594 RepID=A0A481Z8B9_9VIRU|nr:MAG: hypothetical protein LCPAC304_05000 [Pithovirus LCPAC304]
MAAKIGVIDTSLIKEEGNHKRHDHKRKHHKKDVYDDYKKSVPECILITRSVERRKDIQKAKERAKAKRSKYRDQKYYDSKHGKHGKYGSKQESHGSKHESRGSYGDESEDYFRGSHSGFGNGGAYRYKTGGYKK